MNVFVDMKVSKSDVKRYQKRIRGKDEQKTDEQKKGYLSLTFGKEGKVLTMKE